MSPCTICRTETRGLSADHRPLCSACMSRLEATVLARDGIPVRPCPHCGVAAVGAASPPAALCPGCHAERRWRAEDEAASYETPGTVAYHVRRIRALARA